MHDTVPEPYAMARKIARIEMIAKVLFRYGLVVAIGWIGAMKATHYEAVGIQPLIAHNPLLSWGVQRLERGSLYDDHWGDRTHHCCAARGKTLVPTRFGTWKPRRDMHVPDYAFLHSHDTRLGTKPRRVSSSVRRRR